MCYSLPILLTNHNIQKTYIPYMTIIIYYKAFYDEDHIKYQYLLVTLFQP